jgi:hypothetical protein
MLVRLRLLLTWILMAAVPVQGFAAGSMLFCAAATHEVAGRGAQLAAHRDHASHSHEAGDVAKPGTPSGKAAVADTQHQCSLCAACCHSVGITELPSIWQAASVPQADLADPFVLIVSHLTPLPDKPPRA